jgi:hypothetical protein
MITLPRPWAFRDGQAFGSIGMDSQSRMSELLPRVVRIVEVQNGSLNRWR